MSDIFYLTLGFLLDKHTKTLIHTHYNNIFFWQIFSKQILSLCGMPYSCMYSQGLEMRLTYTWQAINKWINDRNNMWVYILCRWTLPVKAQGNDSYERHLKQTQWASLCLVWFPLQSLGIFATEFTCILLSQVFWLCSSRICNIMCFVNLNPG